MSDKKFGKSFIAGVASGLHREAARQSDYLVNSRIYYGNRLHKAFIKRVLAQHKRRVAVDGGKKPQAVPWAAAVTGASMRLPLLNSFKHNYLPSSFHRNGKKAVGGVFE